jgi:excisionase family DNA binding protein
VSSNVSPYPRLRSRAAIPYRGGFEPLSDSSSIAEAAALLRMSRAQLYNRINDGAITSHKDGARTYITRDKLERPCGRVFEPSISDR